MFDSTRSLAAGALVDTVLRFCNNQILQQSTRQIGFFREVIGVIPAVGVDVSQCEAVIAKHAAIRIDAV